MNESISSPPVHRKAKGWRFQFTLRTLFVVVTAVAIAASWYTTLVARYHRELRALEAVGIVGEVEQYNSCAYAGPWCMEPYLRNWAAFRRVFRLSLDHADDNKIKELVKVRREFSQPLNLELRGDGVTNAGLQELATLGRIESISLSSRRITDTGIAALLPLQDLDTLVLEECTGLTDKCMDSIARFPRLHGLVFQDMKIGREGIAQVSRCEQLGYLNVRYTVFSDMTEQEEAEAELLRLRKERPDLQIED